LQGYHRYRVDQRRNPDAWTQSLAAPSALIKTKKALIAPVIQNNPVTRVYEVRIIDIGIASPDIAPFPGPLEKAAGDAPQRVTRHNPIFSWGRRVPLDRIGGGWGSEHDQPTQANDPTRRQKRGQAEFAGLALQDTILLRKQSGTNRAGLATKNQDNSIESPETPK
jgi:hypothetical protein